MAVVSTAGRCINEIEYVECSEIWLHCVAPRICVFSRGSNSLGSSEASASQLDGSGSDSVGSGEASASRLDGSDSVGSGEASASQSDGSDSLGSGKASAAQRDGSDSLGSGKASAAQRDGSDSLGPSEASAACNRVNRVSEFCLPRRVHSSGWALSLFPLKFRSRVNWSHCSKLGSLR
jgi:hypothetical protein